MFPSKVDKRKKAENITRWATRCGVAITWESWKESTRNPELLSKMFTFFLDKGLSDQNYSVWEANVDAGLQLIAEHGQENMHVLQPIFEEYMSRSGAATQDRVSEGAVLFMGALARYMEKNDPKVVSLVYHLIGMLKTPSASVQRSVSQCMIPLVPKAKEHAPKFVEMILVQLSKGKTYGERKGAAFGLSGMVQGLKLSALKKYGILDALSKHIKNKGSMNARQGALFAYERLFQELQSRFEPYLPRVLPQLLSCFGDSSTEVRTAAQSASQMIMSNLTGRGVKLVLPVIFNALNERQWRTKTGAIELLGSMAYCAPQQLSSCLPTIVPKLLDVMSDPKKQVSQAAKQALTKIASEIRNPEIKSLGPILLAALLAPSACPKKALMHLMRTSFVHSVDPPSLAVIIPILRHGLKARVSEVRKMAAQVVGSICSLIADVRDIMPYSDSLLLHLKQNLTGANPEVRTVAATALGALAKGLGDENDSFALLSEELMEILKSDSTSVQRSGAAQGLSQILFIMGLDKIHEILPDICEQTRSKLSCVREAYMVLFQFLPDAIGQDFYHVLPVIMPCILESLMDQTPSVRDAALTAGQGIVVTFAQTQIDMLLKPLMGGMFHENWRIRLCSIQLLGCLLLRLAGLSGMLFFGQPDEDTVTQSGVTKIQEASIVEALGLERRNNIFSLLYLLQTDVYLAVKQMAWRVWKGVVTHTPRMILLLLPTLIKCSLNHLASNSCDRQTAARSSLEDLIQKVGDTVIQQTIPTLDSKVADGLITFFDSMDSDSKEKKSVQNKHIMGTVSKPKITMQQLMDNSKAVASTYNHPQPKHQKGNMKSLNRSQKHKVIKQPRGHAKSPRGQAKNQNKKK